MNHSVASKAQIRWQCRRGMLELDLILLDFFDTYYDRLSNTLQVAFSELLERSDPELYDWLLKENLAPANLREIVSFIQATLLKRQDTCA